MNEPKRNENPVPVHREISKIINNKAKRVLEIVKKRGIRLTFTDVLSLENQILQNSTYLQSEKSTLHRDIPFEDEISTAKSVSVGTLITEQLNAELEKGYVDMIEGLTERDINKKLGE